MGREALGFVCSSLDTASHRHFAIQLTVALGDPFTVQLDGREPREYGAILIPAETRHRFVSSAGDYFFLLINPLSRVGLRLDSRLTSTEAGPTLPRLVVEHIRRCARRIPSDPGDDAPFREIMSLVRSWSADLPERIVDDRVLRAIDECQRCESKKMSVSELARTVHLSESRLVHLFKGETGVPVRRYLKWLRTVDAVGRFQATDASLTEVAHEVGFADSAHLTRTFKEMFGIPPSLVYQQ